MMIINPIPAVSVNQAGAWLEQRLGFYRLEKFPISNRVDEYKRLVSQHDWIFLSKLGRVDFSGEETNHVVVLDAKTQLVYDST